MVGKRFAALFCSIAGSSLSKVSTLHCLTASIKFSKRAGLNPPFFSISSVDYEYGSRIARSESPSVRASDDKFTLGVFIHCALSAVDRRLFFRDFSLTGMAGAERRIGDLWRFLHAFVGGGAGPVGYS